MWIRCSPNRYFRWTVKGPDAEWAQLYKEENGNNRRNFRHPGVVRANNDFHVKACGYHNTNSPLFLPPLAMDEYRT